MEGWTRLWRTVGLREEAVKDAWGLVRVADDLMSDPMSDPAACSVGPPLISPSKKELR